MRLIDGDALYAKLQEHEELARKRVWDTASTLPFPTNLNPSYTRYLAQLDERTALKHMVADAPTIEQPEIIHCRDCKLRDTEYCNMAHGFMGMKDDDYCSYAERREVSE
jgi:hypothetical protein